MALNDNPAKRSLLDPLTPPLPQIGVTVTIGPGTDSEATDPDRNTVSVVINKEGGYDVSAGGEE